MTRRRGRKHGSGAIHGPVTRMGSRLSRPAVHIQAVNAFTDAMATGYRVIVVALLGSAGIGRQQPGPAERGPGPLGAPLPRDQVIVGRGQRTQ